MTSSIAPQAQQPITDLDGIMQSVVNQLPMADGEILYKAEIDNQVKVYTGMIVIGMLMIIVSILLNIRIW
jgi:hypothetical protein